MSSRDLAIVREPPPRAKRIDERTKRIVADVPERIHRLVRLRCMKSGVLVRDYILDLLAQDGIE